MKKFLQEFKVFALKGKVMDMAVGVIIGGAFSTIVKSFVEDILMPVLSLVIGRINISGLKLSIPNISGGDPITLMVGVFLQNVIDFILIAFCVFLLIRTINKATSGSKKEEAKPAAPSREEVLLTEIRDALVKKNG